MRIVIVGAGPAGVTVAETVRARRRDVELVVLSSEPHPPYSPPAMVDHFKTGSGVHLWVGDDWPERQALDYRAGAEVIHVDGDAHRLTLTGGETLDYDRLVIASGARLHAPLEGVDLEGVYNFKSLTAAEHLMARVAKGEASTAVVVGAGFIGMEIALLLSDLGVRVTQVEMLDQVMGGMLDAATAEVALAAMRARRVDVRLLTRASAFVGDARAEGVMLDSGEVLRADVFVAATGIRPNVEFLRDSGIELAWGIVTDDHLRTSLTDVYAAGDAVETPDRLTGHRYVHAILPNAIAEATVVGLNLVGEETPYEGAERMNSLKHLGVPIVAVGLKEGDEVLRTRRDGVLRTAYLRDGRLVGFQLVGDTRGAGVLRTLLNRGDDVRAVAHRLLEPGFGQAALVHRAASGAPA
jgi:NAD(P)H-nitrite reductase large subunit